MSFVNKDWIDLVNRRSDDYINGVENFLKFVFSNRPPGTTEILCPCKNCSNRYYKDRATVKEHCIVLGFEKWYKNWTFHGEDYVNLQGTQNESAENDNLHDMDMHSNMRQLVEEGFGIQRPGMDEVVQSDKNAVKFFKLLKDAETELWEGCEEFTRLSFIVELMHLKTISGWSNKSFTELLKILNRAMPKTTKLPGSCKDAYKMTSDLGFSYKTWDACVNHCMLFRNETEKLQKCKICGASRYKEVEGDKSNNKKIPVKKMWYFPLKPRLQRLYWSSKTSSLMTWHSDHRIEDGVLRHPADSQAWKHFDKMYPTFAKESRNVRLCLASDGFNPYRNMSCTHSSWPVVLIPYNLPPWLCMKQSNFILSVLTQGPKEPGQKIDVYLQPLIEELKELWEIGVHTYDASKNEMFTLRASLMWTLNDFPAYADLSGWSTKGEFACPTCNKRPQAQWLKHSRKWTYVGHGRFLKSNHPFRKDKRSFDGS